MQQSIPVIAIDGPSGVGKGTLCQALAKHFQWHLLDSGAIYRVLGFYVAKKQVAIDDQATIATLALNLPLLFETTEAGVNVILDGEDVSQVIRTQDVAMLASKVAVLPQVRLALLQRQRDFQQLPGLIADGRDMGSVVFPQALVKIFLDASAQARAERRMKQLQDKGICVKFGEILREVTERDDRDRNRAVAPLKPADDALVIDSTSLSIDEVFEKALTYIQQKLN